MGSDDTIKSTLAPGEPAFIRRPPVGVEYTHIKAIFLDLPSPLMTLLWATHSQHDGVIATFKGRTVRAIDRALRRAEQAEGGSPDPAAIRHELVSLCLHEANG